MKPFLLIMLSLFMLINPRSVVANEVVFKGRETISTQPFYSGIKNKKTQRSVTVHRQTTGRDLHTGASRLPIRSTSMSLAAPRIVDQQHQLPIFVMAGDRQSQNWLTREATTLRKIGAQGVVVALETQQEWQQIQRIATLNGLVVHVVNGDAIAKAYKVNTYPTLILDRGKYGQ